MKKPSTAAQVNHRQPPKVVHTKSSDPQTLARVAASNMTGVPVHKIGPGKHPVVGGRRARPATKKR